MLSVEHLVKSLAGRRIIEDVTLHLERGELVGLLGPNGAGKTTTFRMLTGLITPDAGCIALDGHAITELPFYERARLGVAYLPQDPFVPRSLSVEQNIAMVLEAREPSARRRKEQAAELIEQFHLGDLKRRQVAVLSSGQRRRCEMAITLACNPAFALLDEPFARVDPQAIEEMADHIRLLRSRGIGVLITDHNARALLGLVDRSYVIESGRVLAHGTADVLMADTQVRRTYLGEEFRM
ncbi:MAG TPA: LPS export ABC transporter ATP-binding protein [Rhizomicrobium sp.]|nr:LPS export ABC transporter ATP-binding protein [Rhizomicrobium sp.]